MNYTIDEGGIHFVIEPEPIPDDIALATVQRIAAKQRADLEACECIQQGAQPCGACGKEPARRLWPVAGSVGRAQDEGMVSDEA